MDMKEHSTTKKTYSPPPHVFSDMRFWLIVVMLAAFIGILVFLGAGPR